MAHLEVSGTDELLCHCIDSGEIEAPGLVDFNEWQKWRVDVGRRPTKKKDGASTTPKQEAALWRATMASNHGDDWLVDLAARQAPEEEDEEGEATEDDAAASSLQASTTGEFLNPGAAARTASPGSGIITPRRSSRANGEPPGTPGSWKSDAPGTLGSLAQMIKRTFDSANEFAALREQAATSSSRIGIDRRTSASVSDRRASHESAHRQRRSESRFAEALETGVCDEPARGRIGRSTPEHQSTGRVAARKRL